MLTRIWARVFALFIAVVALEIAGFMLGCLFNIDVRYEPVPPRTIFLIGVASGAVALVAYWRMLVLLRPMLLVPVRVPYCDSRRIGREEGRRSWPS